MNRRPKPPAFRPPPPAYRRAFERLDAALERTAPISHTAELHRLGRLMLGDHFDALARTGKPQPETHP